ncbi:spore protease YyaC [Bacillus sp. 1P06AnD]|uniref:spore protease YyaC n=1 Tax=Bacillus sp. 1P06AnD TaxID=3132208 RepID=UPI0039A17358
MEREVSEQGYRSGKDMVKWQQSIAAELLKTMDFPHKRELVIVCIGSDRATGDSLGPLVGSFLEKEHSSLFSLYGTLELPVHAKNLSVVLDEIGHRYKHPYILAIDACLGRKENVGGIQIGPGPLKPGEGVKKELPSIGDAFIKGIVNTMSHMDSMVIQSTRLFLVMKLAEAIHGGILLYLKYIQRQKR